MPLHVVPPYAAALAVVFVALSFRVIHGRRGDKVALGPGDASLHRHIRVHANFTEYAPFTPLLLAMAELHGAWPPLLRLRAARWWQGGWLMPGAYRMNRRISASALAAWSRR